MVDGQRVVAILQARMGSTRLPGKVMAQIAGRPMLQHIIDRALRAKRVAQVVVATTQLPADDSIEALAVASGVTCYRGSEHDVLDRYYQAARQFNAEIIVRLTGDNPLVEGEFIDWCIEEFLNTTPLPDYLDTGSSKRFPYGLSVEVFTFAALETAWREGQAMTQREHVTSFVRENPDRFRIKSLSSVEDNSNMRWTVDTVADLDRTRALYSALDLGARVVSYEDLLAYIRANPHLARVDAQPLM